MGHTRLGRLPRTRKWQDVIGLIGAGVATADIAAATLEAFFSDGERRASTDSHVAVARPNRAVLTPDYLYAYLRGAQGQLQLRSREKGDWKREKVGFRLTELNVADMRKVPVPVPPLAEQRRIVEYVEKVRSRVDTMRDIQVRTAAEIDAMLPAIVDRAFQGDL
jgi:restriction endonuclease S subunit